MYQNLHCWMENVKKNVNHLYIHVVHGGIRRPSPTRTPTVARRRIYWLAAKNEHTASDASTYYHAHVPNVYTVTYKLLIIATGAVSRRGLLLRSN